MMSSPLAKPLPAQSIFTKHWGAAMLPDIAAATRTITLTALSMLPPRVKQNSDLTALIHALEAARTRGVMISFILPAPTTAHRATMRNGTAGEWATARGFAYFLVPLPGLLHAKTVLIDRTAAWIGSGNFTTAAAAHNHECWARLIDHRACSDLADFHLSLIG